MAIHFKHLQVHCKTLFSLFVYPITVFLPGHWAVMG